jgi:hypothetical protein
LKSGIVEQEKAAVARQRRGKHVPAVTNKHKITDELMDVEFSARSLPRLYSENQN